MASVTKYTLGKRAEAWRQDTKSTPQADTLEQRWVNIWAIQATSAAWKRPRYWIRKTRCPGGGSRMPSEYTKGGLNWIGTPAWTSQLSSSNWCHMIQKGHVTPKATSYHPLTKAERFCRKFGNFSHHYLTLCVECFGRNILDLCSKIQSKPHYCDWLRVCLNKSLFTFFLNSFKKFIVWPFFHMFPVFNYFFILWITNTVRQLSNKVIDV